MAKIALCVRHTLVNEGYDVHHSDTMSILISAFDNQSLRCGFVFVGFTFEGDIANSIFEKPHKKG